jgi:uncharacterized membrane protein
MNFPSHLLPALWLWTGHVLYVFTLFYALKAAPWHHLKNSNDTHVLLGSSVILWMIWRLSGGITEGMEFHLLLVTTTTLMFGWPFAVINVSLAQLGLTLIGEADWVSYSLNTLCNGIVPIGVTYWLFRFTFVWLPKHFFVYIFICAFAGGALAMLASRLIGMEILLSSHTYDLVSLGDEPLFIVVMLFPEAFINGMLMTLLVVYRPQWVSSFDDRCYLCGK